MTTATELAELRKLIEGYIEAAKERPPSRRELIEARPRDPEDLDPRPMEIPVETGPPTMRELVHEYVRGALSEQAAEADLGTFEEEDDFEPEDEELLSLSGFEVTEFPFEPEEVETPEKADPVDAPEAASGPPETETEEPAPAPGGTT